MRNRAASHALLAATLVTLAGCGLAGTAPDAPGASSSASYAPRPDAELYAAIRALEGVTDVRIDDRDDINGRAYLGDVFVAAGTPVQTAVGLLDHANAILWQGRPNAVLNISVVSGTPQDVHPMAEQAALGLSQSGPSWLKAARERYGPQPGTGLPPGASASP